MRLLLSTLLLAALAACGPAEPPPASPPADPPDTSAPPEPVRPGPPMPYVVDGACPFECCTYGAWTTTAAVTVYAEPDASSSAFTLDAGAVLDADRGHVAVTRPGIVVADSVLSIYEGPTVQPGDTLYVLDSIGEGFLHAWYQGTVYEVDGSLWNWGRGPTEYQPGPFPARQLQPVVSRWWAHVRTEDGREGWLDMDAIEGGTFEGIDACG